MKRNVIYNTTLYSLIYLNHIIMEYMYEKRTFFFEYYNILIDIMFCMSDFFCNLRFVDIKLKFMLNLTQVYL